MSMAEASAENMNRISDDEEIKCAICLDDVTNRAQPNSCIHSFCYGCIKEWSQVKPECPLCKIRFRIIRHNFRSETDYDDFIVPPPPSRLPAHYHGFHDLVMFQDDLDDELFEVEAFLNAPEPNFDFLFRERERDQLRVSGRGRRRERDFFLHRLLDSPPQPMILFVPEDHAYGPSTSSNIRYVHHSVQLSDNPHNSDSNRTQANEGHNTRATHRTYNLANVGLEIRQNIYNTNVWVQPMPAERHGVIFPSPEYFRSDPTVIARITPWLRREVLALVGQHHTDSQLSIVLNTILSIVYQYDMRSREFHDQVAPFFGPRTSHFQHEFYQFVVSGMRAEEYDFRATYPTGVSPRGVSVSGFTATSIISTQPSNSHAGSVMAATNRPSCLNGSAMMDHDYATSTESSASRHAFHNDHDYFTSRLPSGPIIRSHGFLDGGELGNLRRAMDAPVPMPTITRFRRGTIPSPTGITGRAESCNEAPRSSQCASQIANSRPIRPSSAGSTCSLQACVCDRCTNSNRGHSPNSSSFEWSSLDRESRERNPLYNALQRLPVAYGDSRTHREYLNNGTSYSPSLGSRCPPPNLTVSAVASNSDGFPTPPNFCNHHQLPRPGVPTLPHRRSMLHRPHPPDPVGVPVPCKYGQYLFSPRGSRGAGRHLRNDRAMRLVEPSQPRCTMSQLPLLAHQVMTRTDGPFNLHQCAILSNQHCHPSHSRRAIPHVRIGNSPYGLHIDIFPTGIDATTTRVSTPSATYNSSNPNGSALQPRINSETSAAAEHSEDHQRILGEPGAPITLSRGQSSDEDDCQVVAVKCNSKKPPLDIITISSEDEEEDGFMLMSQRNEEPEKETRTKRFDLQNLHTVNHSPFTAESSPCTSRGTTCTWIKSSTGEDATSPSSDDAGAKKMRLENCLSRLHCSQGPSSSCSRFCGGFNQFKKEVTQFNNLHPNSLEVDNDDGRALKKRDERKTQVTKRERNGDEISRGEFNSSADYNYDSDDECSSNEASSGGARAISMTALMDFQFPSPRVTENSFGTPTIRRSSVIRHTSVPSSNINPTSTSQRVIESLQGNHSAQPAKTDGNCTNSRRPITENTTTTTNTIPHCEPSGSGWCSVYSCYDSPSSSENDDVEILIPDHACNIKDGGSGAANITSVRRLTASDSQNCRENCYGEEQCNDAQEVLQSQLSLRQAGEAVLPPNPELMERYILDIEERREVTGQMEDELSSDVVPNFTTGGKKKWRKK